MTQIWGIFESLLLAATPAMTQIWGRFVSLLLAATPAMGEGGGEEGMLEGADYGGRGERAWGRREEVRGRGEWGEQ